MKISFFLSLLATAGLAAPAPGEISATAYASIQEAIEANPGRVIHVPSGDYEISAKLRLHTNGSGLAGAGRIIQTNPDEPILEINNSADIRVSGLTLTRARDRMETRQQGLHAIRCQRLRIEDVRVIDNRTASAAISLDECREIELRGCEVENYSRLSIDDRTQNDRYGYAFSCIDGTGIVTDRCSATLIYGCRVIERIMLPTPEVQKQYGLGKFVKKNAVKGTLMNQKVWDDGQTDIWHQGSAIVINAPETSDYTQLIGNYIENAAQGMDIHADHVTIAQNIINKAHIGMKAMHGSRNVLIIGNQFSRNDLWAIGLMPGAAAHPATNDDPYTANADGGSIIANNIISDFGHGNAHWIWGSERSPFKFDSGQDPDDPPLADVIVQGNIVHCIGAPRYKYAVIIAGGPNTPQGLHFSNNILAPGTAGIANQELKP